MTQSIFVKPICPQTAVVIPGDGSEGGAIPTYDVQYFDFPGEAIVLPDSCRRGIAPWEALWEKSRVTRH